MSFIHLKAVFSNTTRAEECARAEYVNVIKDDLGMSATGDHPNIFHSFAAQAIETVVKINVRIAVRDD